MRSSCRVAKVPMDTEQFKTFVPLLLLTPKYCASRCQGRMSPETSRHCIEEQFFSYEISHAENIKKMIHQDDRFFEHSAIGRRSTPLPRINQRRAEVYSKAKVIRIDRGIQPKKGAVAFEGLPPYFAYYSRL